MGAPSKTRIFDASDLYPAGGDDVETLLRLELRHVQLGQRVADLGFALI